MLNPAGLWSEGQNFLERKGRKKEELLVRIRVGVRFHSRVHVCAWTVERMRYLCVCT